MVIADVRYCIDDFLTIQLQNDPQHSMGTRMLWPEIEEHEVRVLALSFQSPFFRTKLKGCLFPVFLFLGQAERVHVCRAGRVILAERMPVPGGRHQNPSKIRMTADTDAEHVPD